MQFDDLKARRSLYTPNQPDYIHRRFSKGQMKEECVGSAMCNSSFGEVLQGVRENGHKFLVNLKIKNYSRADIRLSPTPYRVKNEHRFWKSYQLIRHILQHLGYAYNFHLEIRSNIPIGKGLSSSTADMVASVRALENALSISIDNEELSRMITEIEPNDGLHYPGTSFYEHTTGYLIHNFSFVPAFKIVGVDFGGEVDTLEFNRSPNGYAKEDQIAFEQAIEILAQSYMAKDPDRILEVATQSGFLSQKVFPKPYFEDFVAFAKSFGAKGVINTHSGTYLGMVFYHAIDNYPEMCRQINRRFNNVEIDLFETVSF